MNLAQQYISDVLGGNITVSNRIVQAVQRHENDLERSKTKEYSYRFDEVLAARYLNLFRVFKYGKGKWRGKSYQLTPWQAFAVWGAYGWIRKTDGKRRFNKIYIKVARKNGKTEFLGCIANIGFALDGEQDPEIYWFATKKDQAKIGWDRQKQMLLQLRKDSKAIAKYCDTATYRIYTKTGQGFASYLGQDSDTEDGLSPYYGMCDEFHAHKSQDMMNVIESGMGTRENPMTWIITTAGFNSTGPCAQFEKICKQILDGTIENERMFMLIFDLDKDDDWEDPAVWEKANPSMRYIDTLPDFLQSAYETAKTQGATKEVNFRTKNLNIWSSTFSTWIPADKWDEAGTDFEKDDLAGIKCWAGLDLASTRDLCSFCLYFPDEAKAIWWHWLPEDEAKQREKNDSIPYTQWAKDGWIKLTQGNVRDDKIIIQDIKTIAEAFGIQSIAYDRWGAANIVITLTESGAKMEAFGQGFASMSAPTKAIERLIFSNKLNHGNNPVMRWQASNVAIQMDPAENIKIAKNKSTEKVDGMVALAMAIGESMDKKTKWGKIEIYSV